MTEHELKSSGTTLLQKYYYILVAALTASALILLIGDSGNVPWLPPILIFSLIGLCLSISMFYPVFWHIKESKLAIDSARIYDFITVTVRFCISVNLILFGMKKFFGLQFIVPDEIAGLPMNKQSGEWLTWYYFGYSQVFGYIIASLQIIGSWLLMFRRTKIFGVCILLSIMFNLCLINIFYRMNAGALTQSLIITNGLLFLVLQERRKIIDFFFKERSEINIHWVSGKFSRMIIRIMIVLFAAGYTFYLSTL